MTAKFWLEVRDATEPVNLIGWLAVDEAFARGQSGDQIRFAFRRGVNMQMVSLSLGVFAFGDQKWLALNSSGVTLETLRLLPEFKENT